jgi:DNA polymerase-3 subunit delta'
LPATILSRCQRLIFAAPDTEQAAQWLAARIGAETDPKLLLALAEGAPLRALDLAENNILGQRLQIMKDLERLARGDALFSSTAEQLLKIGAQQTLYWLYSWVADMIRYVSSGGSRYMINRDLQESIMTFARTARLQGLHGYLQQVSEALKASSGQVNTQLLMEDILITWQDMFRQSR